MQPLRETDDTFCIAVFGDFLGAASDVPEGEDESWALRRATPDTVLELLRWRPRVRIQGPDPARSPLLEFAGLDGFSPPSLFRRLDLFARYRDARTAVQEGRPLPPWLTGEEGAGSSMETEAQGGRVEESGLQGSGKAASTQGLLDAILDVAEPPALDTLPQTREELQDFVRAVVRPHLVRPDTEGPARLAAVDEAAGVLMSALLHDPAFQELEGLWRSLVFLLSRVDTTGKVRVYAVNVPRSELAADLLGEDSGRGRLQDVLSRPDLGAPARRWGLAVGAYSFGPDAGDLSLLEAIGDTAGAAGVPWISSFEPAGGSADPSGKQAWSGDLPDTWGALRRRPAASWLRLTHPRFLVREPFTAGSGRGRGFAFRESVKSTHHLLWGHGAFPYAALMAQGFAARGRGFRPEEWLELAGMPQGPSPAEESGEVISTSRSLGLEEATRLMESGIVPLIPFPSRAALRLGGIRSLSVAEDSLGER